MAFLWVALGGAIGAVGRYGLSLLIPRPETGGFPTATLIANLLGCFLIGAILPWTEARFPDNPGARLFLVVGLLGGFTTFSAFGWETLQLMKEGRMLPALLYAGISLLAGVAAVWGGMLLARPAA